MSLILDALKKLERDKSAPDPGVVVVGSLPWHGVKPARSGLRLLAAGVLLGVIALAAALAWWNGRGGAARDHEASATTPQNGATAPAAG